MVLDRVRVKCTFQVQLFHPCPSRANRPRASAGTDTLLHSALSPIAAGAGHGHRREHGHGRLAAHAAAAAAASYLPNGTSVLTADSKRLFHPPPWMVGVVARLPPGLRAVEPIELILLVGAMTAGVLVWAAASTVSQQKAARRKASACGDAAALLEQVNEEATYFKLRNRYLSVYILATFGDWIQGGYLYALYAEYGYSMHEIALIFVVCCG